MCTTRNYFMSKALVTFVLSFFVAIANASSITPWGNATFKNFDILDLNSGGLDLIVDGETTYLAAESQGLYILDSSDLSEISVKYHITLADFGISKVSLYSIVKHGNYLYCGFRSTSSGRLGYLKVVNLTELDSSGPVIEINDISFGSGSTYDGQPTGLFINSETEELFIALRLGGLALIDISTPAIPTVVGVFDPGSTEHQQVIVDRVHDRAYFGGWFRGVGSVDISDVDPANWSENFIDDGTANDRYWYLAQRDQYLYVVVADSPSDNSFDEGLAIYDLIDNFSNPDKKPVRVSFAQIPSQFQCEVATGGKDEGLVGGDPGPHQIYLTGNYAVVANGCMGIAIFNITDPLDPFFVREYEIPGQVDWPWSIAITGNSLITVGRNKNNSVNNDVYVFNVEPVTISFVEQVDVELDTMIYSNIETVSGLSIPKVISIVNGEYSVNAGSFTNIDGVINDGDTIQLRLLSSGEANDSAVAAVTIGTAVDSFKVTTSVSKLPTIYENAEDGTITRWVIYDDDPANAVISNVFDTDRQSQVIKFTGESWRNGYVLRNESLQEWNDDSGRLVLEWSMKYSETYIVTAKVLTTVGARYLRYTAVDNDVLGSTSTVNFGLGSGTQDDQWHTHVRDLQQDLSRAQPGVEILKVNAFFVQGSGRVDDVKLHYIMPPLDTDSDGISDDDEISIYFTDPTLFDTDNDGINDGTELIYWSGQWNNDNDADGVVNILDKDSDNDGASDGDEKIANTNPVDPEDLPPAVIYENAEDSLTTRWEIYDNNPLGALINNIFDEERQSLVIDFNGASWTNGYALRNSLSQEWQDDSGKQVLEWSMKYSETYIITAKVMTTAGARYLRYTAVDNSALGTGQTVNLALGSNTQDGQWRTYVRDLQQDLELAQPGVDIIEVNTFFVQGTGRVDDVKLHYIMPPTDTDGDGISDDDEISVYMTNPAVMDSDGDGINDGVELIFWAGQWGADNDGDGTINILDRDSDNDGASDGVERNAGTNPADFATVPHDIVYEDAEDSLISRWVIYDNDPVGALINNIFDDERQSFVMDFNGASWTNGYALRDGASQEWHDDSGRVVLKWSMKFSETYIITAKVMTTVGARYLRYTAVDTDGLGTTGTVNFGLGSGTKDGQWRSYSRNLQQDFALAQPGVEILEVNAFFVQGSGRVDEVVLSY